MPVDKFGRMSDAKTRDTGFNKKVLGMSKAFLNKLF